MNDRIVITGMGTVNPLGLSVDESWKNAIEGKSGVGPITLFDASKLEVHIACEVKQFNPSNYMSARDVRRRDRFEQLAIAAVKEAHHQAGLQAGFYQAERVGVYIASAIGGIQTTNDGVLALNEHGHKKLSPLLIPMLMINGASGMISIEYGYRGPSLTVVSACASGSDAIGMGWQMLRAGIVDMAVVGAAEATITAIGIATFDRVGALSRHTNGYTETPKPFDLHRDGLVMGEGAAVLILEREERAISRGAHVIAEIAGHASSSDAYHVTAPREDGSGGAQAMLQSLRAAKIDPSEVDYINAHGTATKLNDVIETRAIKTVFGTHSYDVAISSTKSMTGHMMGATGALETIFCALAIKNSVIPPTINYRTPDPECDLDFVPNDAREQEVKVAINNAFGFGGHNAVLVIREYL
jgi:3-oxoacyl-[acyl-carrier-protein] synthase II